MTLKQLLTTMSTATVVCWLIWWIVASQVDPNEAGNFGFFLFYISIFFALLGTFFLISSTWRKKFTKYTIDYKIIATSFRQSIFFAIAITGFLFLQGKGLLNILNVALIIIALSVIEWFFLTLKK